MARYAFGSSHKPKTEPFAFAGVYDTWKGDGGRSITNFAIVTTDAAAYPSGEVR